MGVLSHLPAPHPGHGDRHPQVLRRPRRPSLRPLHRRLRLVLLPLHRHPRPRRHMDGMLILLLPLILGFVPIDQVNGLLMGKRC